MLKLVSENQDVVVTGNLVKTENARRTGQHGDSANEAAASPHRDLGPF